MAAIFLSEKDVAQLAGPRMAIDAVEEAFRRLAAREAENIPRRRVQAPGIILHSMSAAAGYLGYVGWKNYTTTKTGARFHVALYEQTYGELVALLEANQLGRLRTAAATAVAVSWMARHDAVELGLFGTGFQAEGQVEALVLARPIKKVFVYGRNAERRRQFADRVSSRLSIEVVPVDRPGEAAEELPMVVTASSARAPVFDGNLLDEGTFVAAVGSNWLNKAEIDSTVIRRADNIVCDSIEACKLEAGDFVEARDRGIFDWSRAVELSDVVAGRATARNRAESITLFKSVGLAIEDVALAVKILERARAEGVGQFLPI
jgi:ornithine cyclodeaminase/alanine dehydrogenase-like protein (mu-crystallin family)